MRQCIRRYEVKQLVPGMVLANAIVSIGGRVLLAERTLLNLEMIEGLMSYGVIFADVLQQFDESDISESITLFDGFVRTHESAVQSLRSIFQRAESLKNIRAEEIDALVRGELAEMLKTPGLLEFIHLVKCRDEYTYTHSLNVALLSGLLCKWLDNSEVGELMTAGLLHDIGKILIDPSLLNKPEKLSLVEMEHMRQHSVLGWKVCATGGIFSENVLTAVLSHHERLDGSGYPYHVKDDEISVTARIVAIADVYDAMSSNRIYQVAKNPFEIMEEIFAEMFCRLDPRLSYVFLKNIKEQLIGSSVLLESGARGRLVFIDGMGPCRSIIQGADGHCYWLDSPRTQVLEVI